MNKLDAKVANVYIRKWKKDDLGYEINPNLTFRMLLIGLLNGTDVYDMLGVSDSLIRERCFYFLADIVGCDYDFLYDLWLNPVKVKL